MHKIFKIAYMVRKIGDYTDNILDYRAVCRFFYKVMKNSAVLKKRYGANLFIDKKIAATYFGSLANNYLLRYLNARGYFMRFNFKDCGDLNYEPQINLKEYIDCVKLAIINNLTYVYYPNYKNKTHCIKQYFQYRLTQFIPLFKTKTRRDIILFVNFALKNNNYDEQQMFNYGIIAVEIESYDIRFILNMFNLFIPNEIILYLIQKILNLTNNDTYSHNIIKNYKIILESNRHKKFCAANLIMFMCSHMYIPNNWTAIADLILPIETDYYTNNEIEIYFKMYRKLIIIAWVCKKFKILNYLCGKLKSWYNHKKNINNFDKFVDQIPFKLLDGDHNVKEIQTAVNILIDHKLFEASFSNL